MALKYKVLERFSEEARREVAGRVFDKLIPLPLGYTYACEDGICVFAALFAAEGKRCRATHPQPMTIARKLGTEAFGAWREINRIVDLNDKGQLTTPEAVRALLLGEEQ